MIYSHLFQKEPGVTSVGDIIEVTDVPEKDIAGRYVVGQIDMKESVMIFLGIEKNAGITIFASACTCEKCCAALGYETMMNKIKGKVH